jgi:hypothetical protein
LSQYSGLPHVWDALLTSVLTRCCTPPIILSVALVMREFSRFVLRCLGPKLHANDCETKLLTKQLNYLYKHNMLAKTILFHIPKELGHRLKLKLAEDRMTLRMWGNQAVENYVNGAAKPTTKPKKP